MQDMPASKWPIKVYTIDLATAEIVTFDVVASGSAEIGQAGASRRADLRNEHDD